MSFAFSVHLKIWSTRTNWGLPRRNWFMEVKTITKMITSTNGARMLWGIIVAGTWSSFRRVIACPRRKLQVEAVKWETLEGVFKTMLENMSMDCHTKECSNATS